MIERNLIPPVVKVGNLQSLRTVADVRDGDSLLVHSFGPPQAMQVGWIEGGVLTVPQSSQRPPSRPSISSAPRTNIALSGGTPMATVSPVATSWVRDRRVRAYEVGRPPPSASAVRAAPRRPSLTMAFSR